MALFNVLIYNFFPVLKHWGLPKDLLTTICSFGTNHQQSENLQIFVISFIKFHQSSLLVNLLIFSWAFFKYVSFSKPIKNQKLRFFSLQLSFYSHRVLARLIFSAVNQKSKQNYPIKNHLPFFWDRSRSFSASLGGLWGSQSLRHFCRIHNLIFIKKFKIN